MRKTKSIERIDDLLLATSQGEVYSKVIKETEKLLLEKALKRSFGNQSIAAKILGINRNTLRMKVKRYGIDVASFRI